MVTGLESYSGECGKEGYVGIGGGDYLYVSKWEEIGDIIEGKGYSMSREESRRVGEGRWL